MATQPLPKNWDKVVVNKIHVYLNHKELTAQFNHPGAKLENALPRTSRTVMDKPKQGIPILYIVQPQPNDLLKVLPLAQFFPCGH